MERRRRVITMLRRHINPNILLNSGARSVVSALLLALIVCGSAPAVPALGAVLTVSGTAQGYIPVESSQVEIAIAGEPIPGSCHKIPAHSLLSVPRFDASADDESRALAALAKIGVPTSQVQTRMELVHETALRGSDVVTCTGGPNSPSAAKVLQILINVPPHDSAAGARIYKAVDFLSTEFSGRTLAALVTRNANCASSQLVDGADRSAVRTASLLAHAFGARLGTLISKRTTATADFAEQIQVLCGNQYPQLPSVQQDAALAVHGLIHPAISTTVRRELTFRLLGGAKPAAGAHHNWLRFTGEPTVHMPAVKLDSSNSTPYVETRGQVSAVVRPDYYVVWFGSHASLADLRAALAAASIPKSDVIETPRGVFARARTWDALQRLLRAETEDTHEQVKYADQEFLPALNRCSETEADLSQEAVYEAYRRAITISAVLGGKTGRLKALASAGGVNLRSVLCAPSGSPTMASIAEVAMTKIDETSSILTRAFPGAIVSYGISAAWALGPDRFGAAHASLPRDLLASNVESATVAFPNQAFVGVSNDVRTNELPVDAVWLQQPSQRIALVAAQSHADLVRKMSSLSQSLSGTVLASPFDTRCIGEQLNLLKAAVEQIKQRGRIQAVIDDGVSYTQQALCAISNGSLYANWDPAYRSRVTQTLRVLSR